MARGDGIKPINNLFEKYKNTLRAPQGSVIKEFCEVVQDVLGIAIKSTLVQYNTTNRVISVKNTGPLKTEILLQQDAILTHLKGRLGERSAPERII